MQAGAYDNYEYLDDKKDFDNNDEFVAMQDCVKENFGSASSEGKQSQIPYRLARRASRPRHGALAVRAC